MLTCKEMTRVCSDEFERPLKLAERIEFRIHLMMCDGCANYRKQLHSLRNVMHAYADGKAPQKESESGDGSAPH